MKFRRFESYEKMTTHVVDLLTTHLRVESAQPRGIMLSGGLTPLARISHAHGRAREGHRVNSHPLQR